MASSTTTIQGFHMDVEPKIGKKGPPKSMVKIMESLIKMDDLGGFPPIFGLTPTFLN